MTLVDEGTWSCISEFETQKILFVAIVMSYTCLIFSLSILSCAYLIIIFYFLLMLQKLFFSKNESSHTNISKYINSDSAYI